MNEKNLDLHPMAHQYLLCLQKFSIINYQVKTTIFILFIFLIVYYLLKHSRILFSKYKTPLISLLSINSNKSSHLNI